MRKPIVLGLILFFSIFLTETLAETSPAELQNQIKKNIRQGQASQEAADAWAKKRDAYLNEIQELKHRKRWLTHQKGKYETYIQKQQAVISALEQRQKETEKIKISLEPALDEWFAQLEAFVQKDLPFLDQEREKRLRFLKASLNDYHLTLDEKTRRLLESLQAEAGYGGTIEKSEKVIPLETGPAQVNIFRLERVALFYLSLDGKAGGWFDPKTQKWVPLPDKYTRVISSALEIAEKKRTPELLELPIGKPEGTEDQP